MEQGHLGDLVEGVAGWEEPGRGLVPVGVVSALIAEQDYPIR